MSLSSRLLLPGDHPDKECYLLDQLLCILKETVEQVVNSSA